MNTSQNMTSEQAPESHSPEDTPSEGQISQTDSGKRSAKSRSSKPGKEAHSSQEETTEPETPDSLSVAAEDFEGEEPVSENSQAVSVEDSLRSERDEFKDQLLRAVAEMENLRRRSARELEERVKYAPGALARDLFPVADNLERALSSLSEELRDMDARFGQFFAGIEAVKQDLFAAFEKHGIHRLDPLEQPFNPAEHEAMMKIQDDRHPPGTVVQVMQTGYRLQDRLLRPAMVGVAEGGSPATRVDETA